MSLTLFAILVVAFECSIGMYCSGDVLNTHLANKSFVARYPPYTPLSAICDQLKSEATKSVESDDDDVMVEVEMLHHPNEVKVSELPNRDKVYLQITAITPDATDSAKARLTFFEQNTSIRSFKYDTPYTDSGKEHGGVRDQKLRRTYIKTQ